MSKISDKKTTTYRYYVTVDGRQVLKDLYDGECHIIKAGRVVDKGQTQREPTYWKNDIAYTIERTNKLALDRPTVTISIPIEYLGITKTTTAAADYCLRAITPYFDKINAQYANRSRPDRENGKFHLYDPGPTVLQRNAAYFGYIPAKDYKELGGNDILINPDIDPPPDRLCLRVRMEVQLPYLKLDRAKTMLCKQLPDATERFIRGFSSLGKGDTVTPKDVLPDKSDLAGAYAIEETQQAIRDFLANSEYCAFIANGSILARERGTSAPMKGALPFQSPPGDEITIQINKHLSDADTSTVDANAKDEAQFQTKSLYITGMGIRRGVTVITGGGYSGKSTVLNAISAGIYNHVAGDGRELCITDNSAATITAEDGRAATCLNISPFIKWIPGGDTLNFSTTHASGSTSQAANIMEAVHCGAKLLLIDEDRSATNFMIRDATMKALIEKEPITPFTDRVQELANLGTATILVIGGSGEYLGVADKVYMMDEFVISDVTDKARYLAAAAGNTSPTSDLSHAASIVPNISAPPTPAPTALSPSIPPATWQITRQLFESTLSSYPTGSGREKLAVSDTGFIIIGDERVDIRNLHDIATPAQVTALAFILRHLAKSGEDLNEMEALALAMRGLDSKKTTGNKVDVTQWVSDVYTQIAKEGLNLVDTGFFTGMDRFMDLPRPFEVIAAIHRMRLVQWVPAQ